MPPSPLFKQSLGGFLLLQLIFSFLQSIDIDISRGFLDLCAYIIRPLLGTLGYVQNMGDFENPTAASHRLAVITPNPMSFMSLDASAGLLGGTGTTV